VDWHFYCIICSLKKSGVYRIEISINVISDAYFYYIRSLSLPFLFQRFFWIIVTKFAVTVICCSVSCREQLVCKHYKYGESDKLLKLYLENF
jgi:hypothetical protein